MRSRVLIFSFVIVCATAMAASAQFYCPVGQCRLNAGVTPCVLFACPAGDTPSFAAQGWSLEIWVWDINHVGIPGIPANDFWLVDCDPLRDASLCGGSNSSNADGPTNANGKTTMSLSTLAGGGCADGMVIVVQGLVLEDSLSGCTTVKCLPILLRSPDIDGNLEVNLADLALFAAAYPPYSYNKCADFNLDSFTNLTDLAMFAQHFGPPGHACQ